MQTFSNGSIPLFLASGRSKFAPQLRFFDVMYLDPPAVGFQVIGATPESAAALYVEEDRTGLWFFSVYETDPAASG